MTTHRPHPIRGEHDGTVYRDPERALLFDDCERCDEHAARPLATIDVDSLGAFWRRMVAVEVGVEVGYATANESKACGVLYGIAVFLERATEIDPWDWPLRCQ